MDCASPTLLPRKVQQAADLGADLVIIDTPPHADIMAREACKAADLILIPCRPQAFDLSAVETTAELVKAAGKPAFVLFMGGPQRAPTTYRDARELIEGGEGTLQAIPGTLLPGAGRVLSILPAGSGWVVVTTQTIIAAGP